MALAHDEERMRRKADAYFDGCGGNPPTLAGLALALGLSRAELLYGRYDGPGSGAVLQAFLRYEAYLEARLHDKDGFRGAELCLVCNCGWDKQPPDDGEDRLIRRLKGLLGSSMDEGI